MRSVFQREVVERQPRYPFSTYYYRYGGEEMIEVMNPYKYPFMKFVWHISAADKWMAEKDSEYICKAIDSIVNRLIEGNKKGW